MYIAMTVAHVSHLGYNNNITRPQLFHGLSVPEEILSGNHERIREFRLNQSKEITRKNRPELWVEYVSSEMNKIR
ncbi:hypothetical protein FACS1894126_2410 [Alphaproteobacteria bacterium]|nr:hypothetical protein FACS1894126_2410 [Alphaproteobacteria bacterium]